MDRCLTVGMVPKAGRAEVWGPSALHSLSKVWECMIWEIRIQEPRWGGEIWEISLAFSHCGYLAVGSEEGCHLLQWCGSGPS